MERTIKEKRHTVGSSHYSDSKKNRRGERRSWTTTDRDEDEARRDQVNVHDDDDYYDYYDDDDDDDVEKEARQHGWRLSRTQKRKPEYMKVRRYNITGLEALGLYSWVFVTRFYTGWLGSIARANAAANIDFSPSFQPFERNVPQLRSRSSYPLVNKQAASAAQLRDMLYTMILFSLDS